MGRPRLVGPPSSTREVELKAASAIKVKIQLTFYCAGLDSPAEGGIPQGIARLPRRESI